MTLSREAKKYILLGTVFGILSITFALLYHYKVISTLNLFTCVTYVVYFAGLALLYNGSLSKTIMIVASAVLLIYGFATDNISFLN